jgi:hypothetical protein
MPDLNDRIENVLNEAPESNQHLWPGINFRLHIFYLSFCRAPDVVDHLAQTG